MIGFGLSKLFSGPEKDFKPIFTPEPDESAALDIDRLPVENVIVERLGGKAICAEKLEVSKSHRKRYGIRPHLSFRSAAIQVKKETLAELS